MQTLVFTESKGASRPGVDFVQADFTRPLVPQLLEALYARSLQSLLVEGGALTLQSFLDAGLWDEAFVEESPIFLQAGVRAPLMEAKKNCDTEQHFGRYIRHYKA